MQGHGAIGEERLDFGYQKVSLFEEITHLKFVTFQFSALKGMKSEFNEEGGETAHTWTPPGRLTDDNIRIASCLELASTFHRRGWTWTNLNIYERE